VDRLRAGLQELVDRTEQSLRESFTGRLEARDVEGMLEVGERICELLPDRPVADEFRRIKPQLMSRRRHDEAKPSLRVVR
jgi:hypothetical protein